MGKSFGTESFLVFVCSAEQSCLSRFGLHGNKQTLQRAKERLYLLRLNFKTISCHVMKIYVFIRFFKNKFIFIIKQLQVHRTGILGSKAESSDDNTWVSGLGSRCCNLSFSSPATIYLFTFDQ